MKFLILGSTGMAGHTISLYLHEQGHDVMALTRRPFKFTKNIICDIYDLKSLEDAITQGEYDAVINCIGILNSDAEANKDKAVFLNSYIPHYLSAITKKLKTKLIHMSTDCVFSGKDGNYNENSFKDGEIFYDRSKALGEIDNNKDLTFRNSIIGPDMNENGIGLFNWFMKQSGEISGYTKAIWTGVTTLTLAKAMEKAAQDNIVGLYNLVNNETINKYGLLILFNKYFKDNQLSIKQSGNLKLDKSLVNNRRDFNFILPSYEDMIIEMKEWIYNHKDIYPHYFRLKECEK